MKITFVLTSFPAYSETFILKQIINAINNKHKINILANHNPQQKVIQPDVKKYNLDKKVAYFHDNIHNSSFEPDELKKQINKNTDLIHCHFLPSGVAVEKALNALNLKIPVLISCYGFDVMANSEKNKYKYLNQANISFIAVSDALKQRLIYLGIKPEKIWIIPLTADVSFFYKINKSKNSKTRFTSICRLVEKKGIDSAIKALSLIISQNNKLKFEYTIYGSGPEENYLNKLIEKYSLENSIKIENAISHKEIIEVFKKTDFLIHASKTAKNGDAEGLPTVVIEAQSCGIPVIGTYHSGIPEEVINNKTGFLSSEDHIYQINKNLIKAINTSNSTYKIMSANARKLVMSRFNDKIINKKIINLYNFVVQNNKPINNNEALESKKSILSIPKKPIKILLFSHSSLLAGSERSLLELIDELLQKDAFITVVLPSNGPLSEELKERSVQTIIVNYGWWARLERIKYNSKKTNLSQSLASLLKAIPQLSALDPDVIYTNTASIPWGAITAKILNKPHVWHLREYGKSDHGLHFDLGEEQTKKFINQTSSAVVVNSQAIKNFYKDHIDDNKITVAYNYIKIPEEQVKEKLQTKFFNLKNSTKLLTLGTIIPSKGQLDALLATDNLIKKGYKVELAIVGQFENKEYANKLIKYVEDNSLNNRVVIHPFINNPYPLIDSADIVLTCSKNEAFGRVTAEAMLLKKPVIGTNSGGTPELIEEGKNGFLYTPGNIEELSSKIEYFLKNKKHIAKFGSNAYQSITKIISKENYGKKILNVISSAKNNYINTSPFKLISESFFTTLIKTVNDKSSLHKIENTNNKSKSNLEKQLLKAKNELNSIKKEIAEIQELNEALEIEKQEIAIFESQLNKIKSAKFFKLWQAYCRIRKLIIGK